MVSHCMSVIRLWPPEQLVEDIAEPCLEHVDLGIRDRHPLRPVVNDTPRIKAALDRPPDARPGLGHDVKVIGKNAEPGSLATIFPTMGARL
jgi:hypothetical protein